MIYKINTSENSIEQVKENTFGELSFKEREHLQEWIAKNPESLNEELLIVQKEFAGFDDTNERLDLLALDKDGNLVIIENKLDDTGRDVVWQALKYTSYCSTLTTEQIIKIYQSYLNSIGSEEDSKELILEFLQIENSSKLILNSNDQRIMFVANNYRKEVTSTVFWLLEHEIQIQCFKATPFSMSDQLLLNIEQIIPPPDTKELMISINEKKKEKQKSDTIIESENRLNRFWSQFKQFFADSGHEHLDRVSVKPRYYIGFGKGFARFNFVIGRGGYRVEMYFQKDEEKIFFDEMYKHKKEIESSFGRELIWQRLDNKKASRIKIETSGDSWDDFYNEDWSERFEWFVNTFDKLYPAIFPVWERVQENLR